jgi:hypothetical protein
MLSDTELIVNSRFIVAGEVRSVFSAWDDEQAAIWTYVEVRTDLALKGDLGTNRIILKQAGGVVGSQGIHVFGQPDLLPGQRVLLYLNTRQDGSLNVAYSFMGMFSILKDEATGEEYVMRSSKSSEVNILSRNDNEEITDRASLNAYLQKIAGTLEREAVRVAEIEAGRAANPATVEPVEYRRKKQESPVFVPSYTFMADGVRWMQADSGHAISFHVNQNNSPITGGATAEIQRAMSAWAATGAGINLQIAGQTGNCGLATDNVNVISFGDCLDQIEPPVGGCAGVLAITRILFNRDARVINGRSFNTLVEADIVFSDAMNCFLSTSANLAEVLCHEIGHAIGLGHSEDTDAIMFGTARGRGRDATLGDDDVTGVLAIYPSTSGGGGGGGNPAPVVITSLVMPQATVNRSYRQSLTASGGTAPYRWFLTGGSLPLGLTLSQNGLIDGTPTRTGSHSFTVRVVDATGASGNFDEKRITLNVVTSGTQAFPVVTRVKVKGSKKLRIFGQNFSPNSMIILNGTLLTPKSFEQDGESDILFYKGKLNLRATGTNVLFIQNPATQSAPFVF